MTMQLPQYPTMPPMRCDHGCGACCGPVLCQESEYDAVNAYAKSRGIESIKQGVTCPWYQDGACQVYDVRPWVCRSFGHFTGLTCERGYNVNVTLKQQASMNRRYARGGNPDRLLHEACYTLEEVAEIVMNNSQFKAIKCLISRGGFSEERVFDLNGSVNHQGAASRRHMWTIKGKPLDEGEPPIDRVISGLVAARILEIHGDHALVSIPDGEVIKIPLNELVDRPVLAGKRVTGWSSY